MAAPDPFSFEDFGTIPDPARGVASRPAPAPVAPAAPSPTRAQRRRRTLLGVGCAVAWLVFLVARLGVRRSIGDAGVLVSLGLFTLVGGAGLGLALRRDARGLPPGLRVLQVILLGFAAFYGVLVLVRSAAVPAVALRWGNVGGCLSCAHLLAAGPLVVATLVFRNSFLSFPAWRGAVIGAACGLGGSVGIHAHCDVETASHLLVAHGLVIVVASLVGAGLGALSGRS